MEYKIFNITNKGLIPWGKGFSTYLGAEKFIKKYNNNFNECVILQVYKKNDSI